MFADVGELAKAITIARAAGVDESTLKRAEARLQKAQERHVAEEGKRAAQERRRRDEKRAAEAAARATAAAARTAAVAAAEQVMAAKRAEAAARRQGEAACVLQTAFRGASARSVAAARLRLRFEAEKNALDVAAFRVQSVHRSRLAQKHLVAWRTASIRVQAAARRASSIRMAKEAAAAARAAAESAARAEVEKEVADVAARLMAEAMAEAIASPTRAMLAEEEEDLAEAQVEVRPFVVQMVAEAEAKAVAVVMDEALASAAAAVVSMAVANAVADDEARAAEAAMAPPAEPFEDGKPCDELEETATLSSLEGGRLEASMTTLAPAAEMKVPLEHLEQAAVGCTAAVLSWLTQTLCGKQLLA